MNECIFIHSSVMSKLNTYNYLHCLNECHVNMYVTLLDTHKYFIVHLQFNTNIRELRVVIRCKYCKIHLQYSTHVNIAKYTHSIARTSENDES